MRYLIKFRKLHWSYEVGIIVSILERRKWRHREVK